MSTLLKNTVPDQQNTPIDLTMLFHQLWANKWMILLVTSISLFIAVLYESKQVPQYESELLLQIKSEHSGGLLPSKLSQQFIYGNGVNDTEATQMALIKSRFILAPVVKLLALDVRALPKQLSFHRWFFPTKDRVDVTAFDVPREAIKKPYILTFTSKTSWNLYDEMGRLSLSGKVGEWVKKKSLRLRITTKDPQPNSNFILIKMPDAQIIEGLQSQLKITDLGAGRQNTGVLRLTLIHANPEIAVSILNTIAKTIQIKDIEKNAIEASKTLKFLEHQLPITKSDLEKSESKLNKYRSKNGKIDIKLQAQYLLQQLTELDKQLSELRITKIDKLQQYTLEHPFIIALDTKIRELNVERTQFELELRKLPAADQIAVSLMRDVKIKSTLYKILLNKIQELQVIKAGIVSDVRILSWAKTPYDPLPSKRNLIYLVGLMLGLMLSFVVILVRKLLSTRILDPHWAEQHFGLVNLAIIPYSKEQKEFSKSATKQFPLLSHTNPHSLSVESLRSVRTALQVRLSCNISNVVTIMGICPGVGKTFVSANLAYLLASGKKSVVLIDTDLRRGTLHKYFNVPATPGLAEILKNQKTLEESLVATAQDHLTLLPRGIYPTDPSELLMSESFKETLRSLSKLFDIVLIDTPPVMLVTDPVLIGLLSGTNYLVLGNNEHQPSDIEMTIRHLTNAGITLHGSIFNYHKSLSNSHLGYGYGYGYGYKSYYDDKEQIL